MKTSDRVPKGGRRVGDRKAESPKVSSSKSELCVHPPRFLAVPLAWYA